MNALVGSFYRVAMPFQRFVLRRRVRRLTMENLDGLSIVVLPDVFNGVVFRTGALLARAVGGHAARDTKARALDMGTGSGLGALAAARVGYRVTAVDVNPEAVRCTRVNALLNRLEERVEVLEGDLFDAVPRQVFDLILFNPPFFGGAPRDLHDLSWRSNDVFPRFVAALPSALKTDGLALVVLSTHGDAAGQASLLLTAPSLSVRAEVVRHFGNETLTVYAVRHAPAANA
ncbi:MAG: methyltransferase [Thermoanaerobaculia bacterium]